MHTWRILREQPTDIPLIHGPALVEQPASLGYLALPLLHTVNCASRSGMTMAHTAPLVNSLDGKPRFQSERPECWNVADSDGRTTTSHSIKRMCFVVCALFKTLPSGMVFMRMKWI